jgi:hypothetical protein
MLQREHAIPNGIPVSHTAQERGTMKKAKHLTRIAVTLVVGICASFTPLVEARNPEMQQRLAEAKAAAAQNKQALAHYTWQEQQTISVKGDVKKQEVFQVQMGPNGKPQKTPISQSPQQSSGGREGRLKKHMIEKKTQEYEDYGHQIAALAQSYTQPDPEKMQAAFQQGNMSLASGGAAGAYKITFKNYVKPNDSMVIMLEKGAGIQSVQIASYLDDPKDAVNISAQFAKIPNGPNHVATTNIDGVSKKLTVATQNLNYHQMN